MKRALSLLLSLALLCGCLPCTAVFAEDISDISYVSLPDEELCSSSAEIADEASLSDSEDNSLYYDSISKDDMSLVDSELNLAAASEAGFKATTVLSEFTQDFEADTPIINVYSTTAKDAAGFGYERPASYGYTYSTDKGLFNSVSDNSKYLTLKTADKAQKYITGFYTLTGLADGDKAHYSFELMVKDFDSDKSVMFTYRNGSLAYENLLKFAKNGELTFGSSDKKYNYSLNRWYKFDIIISFDSVEENTTATHDTYYYMNGKHILTDENRINRKYHSDSGNTYYQPGGLRFVVGASSGSGESTFCVDNIKGKIYPASSGMPTFTQTKFAYTNFDIPTDVKGADGFNASGSASYVDYTLVNGIYGKETSDKSMKVTTSTTISGAAYDSTASWATNNPSTNAYIFNMTSIRSDGRLPVDSQLKFSFSYAFKNCTPTGRGGDYFQFSGKQYGENFFTITRSGRVSAIGSSDTFNLNEEKWYNFDVILTVANDKKLEYTININGIPEITGILNNANLQTETGAVINTFRLCSYVTKGSMSESYLDDMYIEYYTGKDSDTAKANAAMENSEVDLSENGKIFVPAGYTVANLIEDTEGTVKVIRDGAKVEAGTAENALVVSGDLLYVYGYAYVKLKFISPVCVLSDGMLNISADIESNQAESINITLMAAIYQDGKIHSVKAKSALCTTGTTQLKIENASFPEGASVKIYTIEGWGKKYPIFDDRIYTFTYADLVYERPDALLLSSASTQRPRVLINSSKVTEIKNSVDPSLTEWKGKILSVASDALTENVYDYGKYSTGEMKNISEAMDRVMSLGMAYLLTDDTSYSDRAYTEVNEFLQMDNWNTQSYLDVAEISTIVSIAYDWMYDAWTQPQKDNMSQKLLEAIDYTNKLYKGEVPDPNGWLGCTNNWNAVCNGGMAIASVAVMEEDSTLCSQVCERAIGDLEYVLNEFAPYGAWEEGPSYWAYTLKYITALAATLNNAYGRDFGIGETAGLENSVMFALSLEGKTGTMNIGDTSSSHVYAPEMFYWADYFASSDIGSAAKWTLTNYGFEPDVFTIIYYNPTYSSSYEKSLSSYFKGTEIVTFEAGSAFDDSFIGISGGDALTNHGHIDAGSVIVDMAGERFISDIGAEHYGKDGYFSTKRYLYYRARPEGHNIFVINPKDELDGESIYYGQSKTAFSKITEYNASEKKATLDLSYAYKRDASQAGRSISLDGQNVIIEDEIKLTKRSEIHWYFHTDAEVFVSGNTATLTKNGKTISLTFDSGYHTGSLSITQASRYNETSDVSDTQNTSYKKLDFKLDGVSGLVKVKLTASR